MNRWTARIALGCSSSAFLFWICLAFFLSSAVPDRAAIAQGRPIDGAEGQPLDAPGASTAAHASTFAPDRVVACSPGDNAAWWDGFGLPILHGNVYAATVDSSGSLIIGGWFDQAAHSHAAYVARWDGDHWSALAQNLPKPCHSLAWWNGKLVAGCESFGPDAEALVYVFDGSTWSPLGSFGPEKYVNFWVSALIVYNGDLIAAGGFFEHADGDSVGCVARWDGTRWRRMGVAGFPSGDIHSMAVYNGRLFVTGNIFNYDAIAQWDGSSWSTVGAGLKMNQYGDRGVGYSLQVFDGYLYVSGNYSQTGGTPITGLGRWDGTSWSSLGTSTTSRQSQLLCTYQGDLIASHGGNRIGRWNGSSWVSLQDGQQVDPYMMIPWGDRLIASAYAFQLPGFPLTNQVIQFDGASWSPMVESWSPGTMAGAFGSLQAGVTWQGRFVIGSAGLLGAQDHFDLSSPTEAWDGTTWALMGAAGGAGIYAMTIWNDSLVVGMNATSIGGVPAKHIARWDGTSWKAIGTGVSNYVSGFAVYDGELIAVGPWYVLGNTSVHGVARWDGSAWQGLGTGFASGVYANRALAWGADLIVAGFFHEVGGVSVANIASWDGSAWHALGSGLDGEVYALAEYAGELVVGGEFTHAGGVPASGVARWDGSAWSALGDNAIEVEVLRVVEGRLFAAGEFDCGEDEFKGLAVWDGQAWSPIGSGFEEATTSFGFIEPYDGDLYVGGYFGWANGHASFNIARWIGYPPAAVPIERVTPSFVLRAPRPNPSLSEVRLEYELPRAMEARLAIFDAMGRRIATLTQGRLAAGRHVSAWAGRDDRGRARGAGLFFARLETPLGTRTVKIVRDP